MTAAQVSCLAVLIVGIGAIGCAFIGLVVSSSGWLSPLPTSSAGQSPPAATPTPDLAPHDVTLAYDPFAGSGTRDRRSVWLLIVVDRSLTASQARAIGQHYDQLNANARFFYAIFLCEARFANETALTTLTDDKFNPYVMYEYLHWREDPKRPDPLFFTADEISFGGTECTL
jgi:hypothetical protein